MRNTISAGAHKAFLKGLDSKKDIGTGLAHQRESHESAVKNIALGALKLVPGVGNLAVVAHAYGSDVSLVKGIEQLTGKDLSGLKKAAAVADFVPSKLKAGAMGAVEGMTDFVAGGAAQLVGQKDAAKWIYEHSWSQDLSGSRNVDEQLDNGTSGYRVASDLISGIGNVGLQVGIGLATGGAAQAGQISSAVASSIRWGSLFAQGAGSGTAEAVQKTGNVGWKENVAGLGSGAIEVLTEQISPTGKFVSAKITGKTVDETAKYFAKHAIARSIVSDFAGEFIEESSSYFLNWGLQNKILKIDDSPFSWKDWAYEGVMGGIAGGLFAAPNSISSIRNAQKAGAKVYAEGEDAVKRKISEGKVELDAMRKAGMDQDPRFKEGFDIAHRALTELETNDKLTQKQKELYLGLAERAVMTSQLTNYVANLAEFNAEQAKAGLVNTQALADSLNAVVREAGGESNFKAEDFLDKDSYANRVRAIAETFSQIMSPTVEVKAAKSIVDQSAPVFTGSKAQAQEIRNLAVGDVLTYNIGDGAYATITKRGGTNKYSIAYASAQSIADGKGVFTVANDQTVAQVMEIANKGWSGSEVDVMIENAEQAAAEAEERRVQTEILREQGVDEETLRKLGYIEGNKATAQQEQTEKPKRKPAQKKQNGKKTEAKKTEAKTAKIEDLSEVEQRLVPDLGIDRSSFTREEWIEARKYVPNLDTLDGGRKARILTLVRTGNAMGINKTYLEGLVRISAVYNIGMLFTDRMPAKGFEVPTNKGAYVVINPGHLDTTYGHELFHTFAKGADGKTRADLVERVKKIVGAEAFDKAKAEYKKAYKAQFGTEISAELLDEEASASVVGNYLSNMTLLRKIASKDAGLGRRLLGAIRNMKTRWTSAKAFAKENNSTTFAEYRKMMRIENLLMKELGYNRQIGTARNGVAIDRNGRVSFNVTTYGEKVIEVGRDKDNKPILKSGREILEETFRKNGHTEADIKATLDQLDKVYKAMKDLGKDYQYLRDWNDKGLEYNLDTGSLVFSSMVKNGEYEINFDFTTVCKHREAFTKVLEELVRMNKAEEVTLTAQRIVEINTILTKHGLQTACTMCFVESRRNNIRKWAISFVDGKPATKKVPKRMGWNDIVRSVYGDDVQYADFSKEKVEDDTKGVDIDSASDMMKQDMATSEDLAQILSEREDAEQDPEAAAKNTEAKMKRLIKSNKRYAFLIRESDLYGTVGVSAIKRNYPEMYSILLQSYGVATPKITLPAAPYANELGMLKSENYKSLKIDGKTMKFSLGEYTKRIGGARLQSFSDYQMLRFLDYCQLVADAQANGCAIQCYTKEIDMVHLFGLTGMKINMSLVPYVHDSTKTASLGKDYAGLVLRPDGTFDYAIANESIPWKETYTEKGVTKHGAFWYQNQEGYKQNVGTILIGVSKYQILKALADPNIRMIIPYHASGMAKGLQMAYHIDGFEDYTSLQHTRKFNGEKWVNVSKKEEFDFYEAYLRLKGDAKAACLEYLQYCDEHGYRPKFFDASPATEGFVYNKTVSKGDKYVFTDKNGNKLSMNENYYKMIEDFSCYDGDGNVIQQGTVKLALPEDWSDIVIRGLTEAGEQNALLQREMQPILDEVQATAKESSKKEKTYKKLGEEYYKAKQEQIVPGVSDTSYSPAPVTPETDAEYMRLAQDPQKNDSELRRLVKEAGRVAGFETEVYHGTRSEKPFTIFDFSKDQRGNRQMFFSDNRKISETYGQNVMSLLINTENFLTVDADGEWWTGFDDKITKAQAQEKYDQKLVALHEQANEASGKTNNFEFGTDEWKRAWSEAEKAWEEWKRFRNEEGVGYGDYDFLGGTTYGVAKYAFEHGYDGVIIKNVVDTADVSVEIPSTVYVIFESNRVKSADPVTYDDSGNIIPLSERFNPQNDDIRYSPAEPQRRVVTRAQMPRPGITERITNAKGQLNRRGLKNALDNASSAWESFKIVTVNAQQALENQLIRGGMTKRQAAAWSQLARTGRLHANNAIGYALADMTGEVRSDGLMKIITPFLAQKGEVYKAWDENIQDWVNVTAKGGELAGKRYDDFSEYLAMLNAIDRAKVGKNPYNNMTVGQMQKIVAEYEKANPDFKAASEQFSQYNNVMLDILVQSGMVSQELADEFRKKYPHYIPMRTADSTPVGSGAIRGSENLEVKRGLRTAEESNHRVDDPIKNYITQVESRIKAAKLNMLAIEIYETADGVNVVRGQDSRATAKELRAMEKQFLEDPLSMPDPTELFRKFQTGDNTRNEITFYKDGKMLTMAVSDRIYTGFTDLAGQHSAILDSNLAKLSKKINDTFKKLVTNWNPFFAVRNIARDLQDGLLQTQYGFFEFQQMYLKNAQMMASGKFNDLWVEFVANGGLESSLFSDEFATYTIGGKSGLEQAHGVVGQFQHIKNFNTLTEALPRFTEYCLTRKHGGSVQTALLNAADVTVNFGRGGTLTKILNSTVSPFLNPAVQGLDRVVRLFTENGLRNNKALASLLLKAFLLGILPMVLSNAMYGGDKEYEDMKDNVKENNYLFKIGNTWLKIPRGRVVSTISGLYNRSSKQVTGQYVDWADYGKNVLDQITPAQNVARHIASPFVDVANNKTWYGSAIESQSLQNYAVKDRYDENTSRIAVWIGQFTSHFGYSPKKVHYLLDQYSGVVGDILLPATTPAGTRGVVAYNFTVDANTSSNLSERFYKVYNEAMYASNAGDEEAYYLKKRLDETKSAVAELFKEIKTINADSSLSNKEKVQQASAIRAMINQLYKTAVQDAKGYAANVKDAMAINGSYEVVQITPKNAKQYGLTSSDAGKYALTFGGDFVKKYDTEAEANAYKGDASKKTVYAEANRLTYGAEYALREYNVNVYDKAKTLNELGISYDEYYNYYMTARYYSGKTKKDKILAYLNGSGLSKSQIALMMYYSGYTAYADEAKKAIQSSSLSAERKKELLAGITD